MVHEEHEVSRRCADLSESHGVLAVMPTRLNGYNGAGEAVLGQRLMRLWRCSSV